MVLLWAAAARAYSPDICQADKVCSEHTERAVSMAQGNDYHGALEAFTAAYATQPEPRLLVNIGRCLFHLKRFHQALEYYRRFQKAPNFRPEPALKQTCVEYLAETKASIAAARAANVGYLVLSVGGSGARIIVDDYEVGKAPLSRTVELSAGRHRVELRGERPMTSEVTIDAGKEISFSFGAATEQVTARPENRGRLPRPRWRIYGGAVSIAVGVLLVGLGAGALSVNGQCQLMNADGTCATTISEDNMRQTQVYDSLGMGVGLIVPGSVLALAGAALIAWPGPRAEIAPETAQAGPGLRFSF